MSDVPSSLPPNLLGISTVCQTNVDVVENCWIDCDPGY